MPRRASGGRTAHAMSLTKWVSVDSYLLVCTSREVGTRRQMGHLTLYVRLVVMHVSQKRCKHGEMATEFEMWRRHMTHSIFEVEPEPFSQSVGDNFDAMPFFTASETRSQTPLPARSLWSLFPHRCRSSPASVAASVARCAWRCDHTNRLLLLRAAPWFLP